MADRVVKYSALENLYMSVYNEYLDRCGIISEGIKLIPFKEQLIVIAYYLEGESVPDICDRMYIPESELKNADNMQQIIDILEEVPDTDLRWPGMVTLDDAV